MKDLREYCLSELRSLNILFQNLPKEEFGKANVHHLLEVRKRLKQLIYIVEKIISLEKTYFSHPVPCPQNHKKTFEEIELYTEFFYWNANRCANTIKKLFSNFESPKINAVRNDLLEHPKVKTQSFTMTTWDGPRLMSARLEDEIGKCQDEGLYTNLEEYIHNLKREFNAL